MTPTTKKALGIGAAVLAAVLVLAAVVLPLASYLNFPDQHDEARCGVIRVKVSSDWTAYQRSMIVRALEGMTRTCATWRLATDAEPGDVSLLKGDWSVLDNEHRSSPAQACRRIGAGQFELGSRELRVDPGCLPGEQLIAGIMHEFGHWVGMRHVCHNKNDAVAEGLLPATLSRCSPVGEGDGFMNPHAAYGGPADGFPGSGEPDLGPASVIRPTRLDLKEFAIAWPEFQRRWGRH